MPVYTVHAPTAYAADFRATDKFVFVRDGFHFWAMVFGPLWLIWKRLWLALVGWLILFGGLEAAVASLRGGRLAPFAVGVIIAILMGLEGSTLQRWTFSRRKWRQLDVVVADDEESAERRFFDRWTNSGGKRWSGYDPLSVDPELDMYADGREPPFDEEFVRRYRAGQRARNQRVTDWAKAELARLNGLGVPDRLFLLPRTWADLRFVDATLDPSERPVPYCYRGDPRKANLSVTGIGAINTLRSWLSMWSLETSQARSELHLAALTMPALVIQATADSGVFPSDADTIYAQIAAADKTRLDIKGEHYFRDRPDGRDEVASAIADWIAPRRA